jgi:hypothetical protein
MRLEAIKYKIEGMKRIDASSEQIEELENLIENELYPKIEAVKQMSWDDGALDLAAIAIVLGMASEKWVEMIAVL